MQFLSTLTQALLRSHPSRYVPLRYTGSNEQAFVIGGGTAIRHFKRAVAFGHYDSKAAKEPT